MFLLTGFLSVSACDLSITNNEACGETLCNTETVTVTIHSFYDVNGNGVQDTNPNEGDAIDFFVLSSDEPWGTIFEFVNKGKTDNEGFCSFETRITDNFAVWVMEKRDMDDAQWRTSEALGGFLNPIPEEDYYEVIEIPVTYHEKNSEETKAKPMFINILLKIFDQFPLLTQLLQRLPAFQQ